MPTPQFRTKTGRLTAYSFACGYIEIKQADLWTGGSLETQLLHDGACYHVRQYDRRPGAKTLWVLWERFIRLPEARNCFNRCRGRLVNRGQPERPEMKDGNDQTQAAV